MNAWSMLVLVLGALPAAAATDREDAALAKKLAGYAECVDDLRSRAYESRAEYLGSIAAPESGPAAGDDVDVYDLRDPADCGAAIAAAERLPPDDPQLEAAARAWLDAVRTLHARLDEADRYYELEDHLDDDFAKGKALHAPLVAAFAAFEKADGPFFDALDAQLDALSARRVERLAGDPARRAEYLVVRLVDLAKRLTDLGRVAAEPTFQREAFDAVLADFRMAYEEADAYRREHPEDRRRAFIPLGTVDAAFDLLKSAKALSRRARDGMQFDEFDQSLIEIGQARTIDGHPAQLVETYNDLARAFDG